MNISISRANPEDAAEIAAIGAQTFKENFGVLFHNQDDFQAYLDSAFALDKIKRSLNKKENYYWKVLLNGSMIAYAKIKFPNEHVLVQGDKVAKLQRLYILKEETGLGIGAKFLEQICGEMLQLGMEKIWLLTLDGNNGARKFYERLSYKSLGPEVFNVAGQDFTFLVYTKDWAKKKSDKLPD